jgi:hypothetical protein
MWIKDLMVYHTVNSFLTAFMIYMTEVSGRMRRKADNKKLTRVLFTKLSIDGYNRFVIYAKTAHAQGNN